MKRLQGATIAIVCALLTTSIASAQSYPVGMPPAASHGEYIVEGPGHHAPHGLRGPHGSCCSRGGCYPEDSCCDPCGPHGLAVLFNRMKAKLCQHRCPCRKKCCTTVCEPACGAVDHCCPQKTCCPYPTSCAPELGPCCDTRRCKKPFFLSRLFSDPCRPKGCEPTCGAPVRDGCCAPVIHRGDYPFPPVPSAAPAEQYKSAPRQPSRPQPPATETSGDRRYNGQKSRSATAGRSSRGPI